MTIELFELELLSSRTHTSRPIAVGVEQELLVRDVRTGGTVDPDRLRRALADNEHAEHVTFEPGGQLELSLPCAADAASAARGLRTAVASVRQDVAVVGVELLDDALDLRPTVPRRLHSRRYDAMERHFDTIGPAGRVMMRCTASTQVCLDWWPGADGVEQWRVLQLCGPLLAAAYARSTGPRSRLATWLAVDPDRTAFDDRLLHGDPAEAYARFAAAAVEFKEPHLTTLFPPVRPRDTYLEVRYLDAQPMATVAEPIEVLARIAHDDDVRRRVLADLEPRAHRLAEDWRAAAAGCPVLTARGRALAASVLRTTDAA
jgi:gamma-glutamylcysteine synthetase